MQQIAISTAGRWIQFRQLDLKRVVSVCGETVFLRRSRNSRVPRSPRVCRSTARSAAARLPLASREPHVEMGGQFAGEHEGDAREPWGVSVLPVDRLSA